MRWGAGKFWAILLFAGVISLAAFAQEQSLPQAPTAQPSAKQPSTKSTDAKEHAPAVIRTGDYQLAPGEDPQNQLLLPFLRHLGGDQKTFWTSPLRIKKKDLPVLLPFAAFTGGLIAGDSWISRQVPDKPNQLKRSRDVSNYAVYSLVGVAGGSYLLGHLKSNDHLAETGLLSAEAAINSTAVTYAFKAVTQRPRPYQTDGNGTFFQGGYSFPSEHAAVAWSAASVFAHEYPGPISKLFAYGLASTVTLTRVTGRQHFSSDVVVGSALGYFLGRQIYRAHHDPEVGGGPWGELSESREAGPRNPRNMGSPYVPIDNWVYAAFDRLAALGYAPTAYAGMRPWTRMECARILDEAGERIRYGAEPDSEAQRLYDSLATEFSDEGRRLDGAENLEASVDSIYLRSTEISGQPLRDGYHLAQTLTNDYGRPYGQGFNAITGVTAHAVVGPIAIGFSGEYQHAPAVPAYPAAVLQDEAGSRWSELSQQLQPADRPLLQLLDATVAPIPGRTCKSPSASRASGLGTGGRSGPLLFSDNAAPLSHAAHRQSFSLSHSSYWSKLSGTDAHGIFSGAASGQDWTFAPPTLYGPDTSPRSPGFMAPSSALSPHQTLSSVWDSNRPIRRHRAALHRGTTFCKRFTQHESHSGGRPNHLENSLSAFDFSYRIPGLRKLAERFMPIPW